MDWPVELSVNPFRIHKTRARQLSNQVCHLLISLSLFGLSLVLPQINLSAQKHASVFPIPDVSWDSAEAGVWEFALECLVMGPHFPALNLGGCHPAACPP